MYGFETLRTLKKKRTREGEQNPNFTRKKVVRLKRTAANLFNLVSLLSERTSLCKTSLTSRGLAQDNITAVTLDYGLGMAKDCRDDQASRASDVHEKTVRTLYESLQLVSSGLFTGRWVS